MPVKMGDNGYEYECSRAELLGIAPPSYEEYLKKIEENGPVTDMEEHVDEVENLEEPEKVDEDGKVGGKKLVEINNVLQSTQEKLNRFKASYGSFANTLKSKLGKSLDISFSQSDSSASQANDDSSQFNTNTDNNQDPIIGSIVNDNDSKSNQVRQNGQTSDLSCGDEAAYKEIQLNETESSEVKSPEVKKFLNFSFLNLGSGK